MHLDHESWLHRCQEFAKLREFRGSQLVTTIDSELFGGRLLWPVDSESPRPRAGQVGLGFSKASSSASPVTVTCIHIPAREVLLPPGEWLCCNEPRQETEQVTSRHPLARRPSGPSALSRAPGCSPPARPRQQRAGQDSPGPDCTQAPSPGQCRPTFQQYRDNLLDHCQ